MLFKEKQIDTFPINIFTEPLEDHQNCIFRLDQNPFAPGELICRDHNIASANLFFRLFFSRVAKPCGLLLGSEQK
jgi:hypothetical protein